MPPRGNPIPSACQIVVFCQEADHQPLPILREIRRLARFVPMQRAYAANLFREMHLLKYRFVLSTLFQRSLSLRIRYDVLPQGESIQFNPVKFFSGLHNWQGACLKIIIHIGQYSAVIIANKVYKSDEAARTFKIIKKARACNSSDRL